MSNLKKFLSYIFINFSKKTGTVFQIELRKLGHHTKTRFIGYFKGRFIGHLTFLDPFHVKCFVKCGVKTAFSLKSQ